MQFMKMKHWISLLLFAGLLTVGIVAAVSFRVSIPSFIPSDANVAELPVGLNPDFGDQNQDFSDLNGEALAERAELVVVVTPTGTRQATSYATLSEFKVEQVLKENENVSTGDTIYVYEAPIAEPATKDSNGKINLYGFHTLMKPGHSYLLLLNFYKRPEGWEYTEENLKTYLLMDGYYGKYPIEEPNFLIIHESEYYGNEKSMVYSEIADYDCAYVVLDDDSAETNAFKQTYTRLREELIMLFEKDGSMQ